MGDIKNFTANDGLGHYDRESNPQGLSVFELLPKEVSWSFLGHFYKVQSQDKLIPLLLVGEIGVAIVFSPFNAGSNNAMVIKPDGGVMWDVGTCARAFIGGGIFTDVYYVLGQLNFFVNIKNQDYRFSFDVVSGEPGKLIPSL